MAQHEHKEFSCPACGAEFDTREQLESHAKSEHKRGGQAGGSSSSTQGSQTPDKK
jgi:hypothetical protein